MRTKYVPARSLSRWDLDMSYDALFKLIFFRDSARSGALRRALLQVMLNEEMMVERADLMHGHFMNADEVSRQRITDGACRINERDVVIAEMQMRYVSGDEDRFTAYLCGLNEYRFRNREDYKSARNIELVFMKQLFPHGMDKGKDRSIEMRNSAGESFSRLIRIKIIPLYGLKELLKRDASKLSSQERYRLWLRYGHEPKYEKEMRAIIAKEEGLRMAEAEMERIMAQREEDDKELFCEIMNRIQDKFDAWQTKLVEEERDQAIRKQKEAMQKEKAAVEKNLYLQHLIALLASGMSYEEALKQCTPSIPTDAIHG